MTLQAGAEQPEQEYYFSWTVHYLRKNYPPGCGKSYSVAEIGKAYLAAHPHHVGCTRWLQDSKHLRITDVESAAYCGMPAKPGRNLQCKRSPPDAERDLMPLDQPCTSAAASTAAARPVTGSPSVTGLSTAAPAPLPRRADVRPLHPPRLRGASLSPR